MSLPLPFNEVHRDCLQEVCNIAMGVAGQSLAEFTQVFVNLSVPKVRFITPHEIAEALVRVDEGESVSAVVQPFTLSNHSGYALVVITESSLFDIAEITKENASDDDGVSHLLCELSKTINGSCLPELAQQLDLDGDFTLAPPKIVSLHLPLNQLRLQDITNWEKMISIEINYHLESHSFNGDLLLLFPEIAIVDLVKALDRLVH